MNISTNSTTHPPCGCSVKIEKKPTSNSLLTPLVKKLMSIL